MSSICGQGDWLEYKGWFGDLVERDRLDLGWLFLLRLAAAVYLQLVCVGVGSWWL